MEDDNSLESMDDMFNELDGIDTGDGDQGGDRDTVSIVKDSAMSSLTDPDAVLETVTESVKDALPSPIKNELYKAEEIHTQILEPISKSLNAARKTGSKVVNTVADIMPEIPGVTSTLRKIAESLQPEEEDDDEWSSSEQSEDEIISNNVNDIFGEQKAEERTQEKIAAIKDLSELELNIKSVTNLEILKDYFLTDHYNYIKKDLELQFRQSLTLIDIRNRFGIYAEESREILKGILKNTSLPDVVKVKTSEVMEHQLKQKAFSKGIDLIGKSNFVEKLKSNLTNKVVDTIQSYNDMANDGGEMINSLAGATEGMSPDQKLAMASEMGAQQLISFLTSTAMNTVKKSKTGDKLLGKTGKLMQRTMNDPMAIIEKLLPDAVKNRRMYRGLKDAVESAKAEEDVKSLTLNKADVDEPAIFDTGVKRSITNIIPNLLSKIINELKGIRTGKAPEQKDELVFDHNSNRFITRNDIQEKVIKEINENKENTLEEIDRGAKRFGDLILGRNYSKEDIADVKEGIEKLVLSSRSINVYDWYRKPEILEGAFKPKILSKVYDHIRSLVETDNINSMETINDIEDNLKRIKNRIDFRSEGLDTLIENGFQEDIEKLGLVEKDSDSISSRKVKELITKGIEAPKVEEKQEEEQEAKPVKKPVEIGSNINNEDIIDALFTVSEDISNSLQNITIKADDKNVIKELRQSNKLLSNLTKGVTEIKNVFSNGFKQLGKLANKKISFNNEIKELENKRIEPEDVPDNTVEAEVIEDTPKSNLPIQLPNFTNLNKQLNSLTFKPIDTKIPLPSVKPMNLDIIKNENSKDFNFTNATINVNNANIIGVESALTSMSNGIKSIISKDLGKNLVTSLTKTYENVTSKSLEDYKQMFSVENIKNSDTYKNTSKFINDKVSTVKNSETFKNVENYTKDKLETVKNTEAYKQANEFLNTNLEKVKESNIYKTMSDIKNLSLEENFKKKFKDKIVEVTEKDENGNDVITYMLELGKETIILPAAALASPIALLSALKGQATPNTIKAITSEIIPFSGKDIIKNISTNVTNVKQDIKEKGLFNFVKENAENFKNSEHIAQLNTLAKDKLENIKNTETYKNVEQFTTDKLNTVKNSETFKNVENYASDKINNIKNSETYKNVEGYVNNKVGAIKDSEIYENISKFANNPGSLKSDKLESYIKNKFKDKMVEVPVEDGDGKSESAYLLEIGKYTLMLPAAALASPFLLMTALKGQVSPSNLTAVTAELMPMAKDGILSGLTSVKNNITGINLPNIFNTDKKTEEITTTNVADMSIMEKLELLKNTPEVKTNSSNNILDKLSNLKQSKLYSNAENILNEKAGQIKNSELYKNVENYTNDKIENIKNTETYKNVENYTKDKLETVKNTEAYKQANEFLTDKTEKVKNHWLFKNVSELIKKENKKTVEAIDEKVDKIEQENKPEEIKPIKPEKKSLFSKLKGLAKSAKQKIVNDKDYIDVEYTTDEDDKNKHKSNLDIDKDEFYKSLPEKVKDLITIDENGSYILTVNDDMYKVDKDGLTKLLPTIMDKIEKGTVTIKSENSSNMLSNLKNKINDSGVGGALSGIGGEITGKVREVLKENKGIPKEMLKQMFGGKDPMKEKISAMDIVKAFTVGTAKSSFWFGRNVLRPGYKGMLKGVGTVAHKAAVSTLTNAFGFSPGVAESVVGLAEAPFKIVSKALGGVNNVLKKTKEAFQGLFGVIGKMGKMFLSKTWGLVKKGLGFLTGKSEDEIDATAKRGVEKVKATGKKAHDKWMGVENKNLLTKTLMAPIRHASRITTNAPKNAFNLTKGLANTFIITDKEEENLWLNRKAREAKGKMGNIKSAVGNINGLGLKGLLRGGIGNLFGDSGVEKYIDSDGRTVVSKNMKNMKWSTGGDQAIVSDNNTNTNTSTNIKTTTNNAINNKNNSETIVNNNNNTTNKVSKPKFKLPSIKLPSIKLPKFSFGNKQVNNVESKEPVKQIENKQTNKTDIISTSKHSAKSLFSKLKNKLMPIKHKQTTNETKQISSKTSKKETLVNEVTTLLSKLEDIHMSDPNLPSEQKINLSKYYSEYKGRVPNMSNNKLKQAVKSLRKTLSKHNVSAVVPKPDSMAKTNAREKKIEELRVKQRDDKKPTSEKKNSGSSMGLLGIIGGAVAILKKMLGGITSLIGKVVGLGGTIVKGISSAIFGLGGKIISGITKIPSLLSGGTEAAVAAKALTTTTEASKVATVANDTTKVAEATKATSAISNGNKAVTNVEPPKKTSFFGSLWDKTKSIANKVKTGVSNTWDKAKTAVSKVWHSAKDIVKHSWSSVKDAVGHLVDTPFVKKLVSKVKNTLPMLKKKLFTKVGEKEATSIFGKVASKFVPGVGTAMLMWDAGNIAWDMLHNHTSFLPALSKQMLGINLFGDDNKPSTDNEASTNTDDIKNKVDTTKPIDVKNETSTNVPNIKNTNTDINIPNNVKQPKDINLSTVAKVSAPTPVVVNNKIDDKHSKTIANSQSSLTDLVSKQLDVQLEISNNLKQLTTLMVDRFGNAKQKKAIHKKPVVKNKQVTPTSLPKAAVTATVH